MMPQINTENQVKQNILYVFQKIIFHILSTLAVLFATNLFKLPFESEALGFPIGFKMSEKYFVIILGKAKG